MNRFKETCDKIKAKWDYLLLYKKGFDDDFENAQKNKDAKAIQGAHINISRFHQELLRFRTAFNSYFANVDKFRLMWKEYELAEYGGPKVESDRKTFMKKVDLNSGKFAHISVGDAVRYRKPKHREDEGFTLWDTYDGDKFTIVGFTEDGRVIILYEGKNKECHNKVTILTGERFCKIFK